MDYKIEIDAAGQGVMSFEKSIGLFNNVYLTLSIKKGSWWHDPAFGLRDRGRQKNTPRVARLLAGDIHEALQWLLDTKRATKIDVAMERDTQRGGTRLKAVVTVTSASGSPVTFDKFFEVV